jgi:hypothetical protein
MDANETHCDKDIKEIHALLTDAIHVVAELLHSMPSKDDAIHLAGRCIFTTLKDNFSFDFGGTSRPSLSLTEFLVTAILLPLTPGD